MGVNGGMKLELIIPLPAYVGHWKMFQCRSALAGVYIHISPREFWVLLQKWIFRLTSLCMCYHNQHQRKPGTTVESLVIYLWARQWADWLMWENDLTWSTKSMLFPGSSLPVPQESTVQLQKDKGYLGIYLAWCACTMFAWVCLVSCVHSCLLCVFVWTIVFTVEESCRQLEALAWHPEWSCHHSSKQLGASSLASQHSNTSVDIRHSWVCTWWGVVCTLRLLSRQCSCVELIVHAPT